MPLWFWMGCGSSSDAGAAHLVPVSLRIYHAPPPPARILLLPRCLPHAPALKALRQHCYRHAPHCCIACMRAVAAETCRLRCNTLPFSAARRRFHATFPFCSAFVNFLCRSGGKLTNVAKTRIGCGCRRLFALVAVFARRAGAALFRSCGARLIFWTGALSVQGVRSWPFRSTTAAALAPV